MRILNNIKQYNIVYYCARKAEATIEVRLVDAYIRILSNDRLGMSRQEENLRMLRIKNSSEVICDP